MSIIACEEKEDYGVPRLFKPVDLSVRVSYNNVSATWRASEGAEGYEIEASVDTFRTVDAAIRTDAKTLSAQFTGLQENRLYSFRLRAVMGNPELDSRYIYAQATTQASFTVFYPVDGDSISYSAVILKLREKVTADRVVVVRISDETLVVERNVIAAETESRRIGIGGLAAGVSYRVTLYNGAASHGYTTFTLPVAPEGMIIIDNDNKDRLQALLDNAGEDAVFLFTGADIFDYSTTDIVLSKAVTLMGEPGVAKPRLYVKSLLIGGRNAAASAVVGKISLLRLELSGYKLSGGAEQLPVEPNRCLLSCDFTQTPHITVRQIDVQDCTVRNYSFSFLELNEGLKADAARKAVFDEINVTKTLAFDLGRNSAAYPSFISICNDAANNGFCRRFNIRNSTFHHLMRGLIEARIFSAEHADANVLIEGCTFDYFGKQDPTLPARWYGTDAGQSKPALDFTASGGIASGVLASINNCIFGEFFAVKLNNYFSRGISTVSFGNTFMLNASKQAISSGTMQMTGIGATADELFPDRANGNYATGVDGNINTAGDPRWR